jgi:hypothetical protein
MRITIHPFVMSMGSLGRAKNVSLPVQKCWFAVKKSAYQDFMCPRLPFLVQLLFMSFKKFCLNIPILQERLKSSGLSISVSLSTGLIPLTIGCSFRPT